MEEGNGGILTSGVGCYAPDYKISSEIENYIMKNIISNVLSSLERKQIPYMGILGVDCVLKDDGKISVLEFRTFLSDHDCQAVLNLINDNLYLLFEACANGSFADDYEKINFSDASSVSCVIYSRKNDSIITGLNFIDQADINHFSTSKNKYMEYTALSGRTLVVTKTANTLSRARYNLYEDIEMIKFDGKKYRNDICPDII